MTTSNLDLARECGASYSRAWDCNEIILIRFTPDGLDDFAERIRADERASVASATVQPVALPAGMPESVGYVGCDDHCETHPTGTIAHLNTKLPAGTNIYTAAQVQAMLAAHVPVASVVHRKISAGHDTHEDSTFDVQWLGIDPCKWSGDLYAVPPPQAAQPSPAAVEEPFA